MIPLYQVELQDFNGDHVDADLGLAYIVDQVTIIY